jgi:hypothetical protein
MTGSIAIDVVISLVFIYLLYSLLATIIQEIVASNILSLRSKVLEEGIKRMLDDDDHVHQHDDMLSKAFYNSPLVKYLGQSQGKKPAYLSAANFSKVMLDILKGPNPLPGDDFRKKIDDSLTYGILVSAKSRVVQGDTFQHIKTLWADAQGDIDKFRIGLEQWFDDAMDRATGWYRRKTQGWLIFIGFVIAVVFNVDTIEIAKKLSRDPDLAAKIAQQADNFIKTHPNLEQELELQKQRLAQLGLPASDSARQQRQAVINYMALKKHRDSLLVKADSLMKGEIQSVNSVLGTGIGSYQFRGNGFFTYVGYFSLSILGWALTALAISLGAPFWFDLLNKLMKLRSSVPAAPDDSTTAGTKGAKQKITIKG